MKSRKNNPHFRIVFLRNSACLHVGFLSLLPQGLPHSAATTNTMGAGSSTAAQEAVWERMETRRQESIAFAAEHAAGWAELQEAFGKDTKVLSVASSGPQPTPVSDHSDEELTEYDAIRTRPWNKDCHGCVLSSPFSNAQSLFLVSSWQACPSPFGFPPQDTDQQIACHPPHIAPFFVVVSGDVLGKHPSNPPHCYGWAARTAQLQDVSFSHDVMGVHGHANTGKTKLAVVGAVAPTA
jgi:hypothetical protein